MDVRFVRGRVRGSRVAQLGISSGVGSQVDGACSGVVEQKMLRWRVPLGKQYLLILLISHRQRLLILSAEPLHADSVSIA